VYVDHHVNPSAGRLAVLTSDLKRSRTFRGGWLGIVGDGVGIYHRNQGDR
jgi:hypothetical protein